MVVADLDPDQRVGRRAAVGLLAAVATGLIAGPIMAAANLIIVEVTGREPDVAPKPGMTVMMIWRGSMPIDVPWWVFLAVSLSFGVLLAVVWSPARHYFEFWRRRVILVASPKVIALCCLAWAGMSFAFGAYYTAREEWQGFLYIPVIAAISVGVVAFLRGRHTGAIRPEKRRDLRSRKEGSA